MNLPALQYTEPVIMFDFAELKRNIEEVTSRYKGLVFGENDVADVKSVLAMLNGLAKGLADARKEAVAKVSAPIKEFESQVKEMETLILTTRGTLDEQVKAFVQKERDNKKAHVQFIIDAQKDEYRVAIDMPIKESWLNKTAKDKTTAAEVQAIILKHIKQEQEAAALEQAKKDRIVAIETHLKVMQAKYGYEVPFSDVACTQCLDMTLQDVYAVIEGQFEVIGEIRKAAAEREAARAAQAQPQQPAPHHETYWTAPVQTKKSLTITAMYNPANSEKIRALCKQLETLCTNVVVQVK